MQYPVCKNIHRFALRERSRRIPAPDLLQKCRVQLGQFGLWNALNGPEMSFFQAFMNQRKTQLLYPGNDLRCFQCADQGA